MKYIIRDCQFECRYFADGAIFNSKKRILYQLASYHSIDFTGVKNDGQDTPYKDIWEFLMTLENDETRLNWILDYGEWEIEKVKQGVKNEIFE